MAGLRTQQGQNAYRHSIYRLMIEVIDFTKKYSNKAEPAVSNISFKVEKGSITALLGPNGAGKTTIIKAVCGFHYATEGKILLTKPDGAVVDTAENPEEIMQLTGYVPEKPVFPKELKVSHFLNYCAELHGITEKKAAVDYVVEKCSLSKVLDKKIKQLSKGYQQRLSFAQAIIHKPSILILDEPITGLDPVQILQMRELIKELSKDKAIIMSTHILQEVNSLCDKICIMNNGKLAAYGTEKEILKQTGLKSLEEAFVKLAGDLNE